MNVKYPMPDKNITLSDSALKIHPLQSTFRGGKREPVQQWYPYLEGYSPEFVRQILKQYAPEANNIFDPFAGTGTTPITAMAMKRNSYYCEINPVLQFVTETKANVYKLKPKTRADISKQIKNISDSLQIRLDNHTKDEELQVNYSRVFGDSVFFDKKTFSLVLKARSVVDKVRQTSPLIADLLTLAILASLVKSSNLIRSGDIRYRKSNNDWKKKRPFIKLVTHNLQLISSDLLKIETYTESPAFVCSNAKQLPKTDLKYDMVITSPPYLNGTNYFRNTKMELWFLRRLHHKNDLANFRFEAVTAGINNVTKRKTKSWMPENVRPVVQELEEVAYDARIPKMVGCYFAEMEIIFSKLVQNLEKRAKLAIDIGDSIYAGVHVETDNLLINILKTQKIELVNKIILRERTSRSQVSLSQVLLLLEYQG